MKSLVFASILIGIAGCSTYIGEQRPPWRAEAENACLAAGAVRESPFVRAAAEINGPGICGLVHPFKVTALSGGAVTINTTQTLDCPMIAALDSWLAEVVQPSAQARFGEKVVRINAMGSYVCRGINNMSGAHLSEHAFGNALDIGGFVLESGRELNITRGFNGPDEQERAFLHEVHAGACGVFTTTLGPGYNVFHYNHFHVDLAMHGATARGARRYCKPVPQTGLPEPPRKDDLPDPPPIEEELDIARAPVPAPGRGSPSLLASVPARIPTTRTAPSLPATVLPSLPATAVARMPERGARPAGVISFASPDPDMPDPAPRLAAPRELAPRELGAREAPSPTRLAAPRRVPAETREGGMGTEAEEADSRAAAAPRRRPAAVGPPDAGTPADWDATSAVR